MQPTINVDGVERPTTNNLGDPIHEDVQGVTNFWRWFGNSKVVDEYGRPIVVYHGTSHKFDKIDMDRGAQRLFWLTSCKASIEDRDIGAQGFGVIMELYAKIQGPADWKQYDNLMLDEFRSRGLDGAVLPDKNGFTAFVFHPDQIKAAKGNSGEFSPDSHMIYDKPAAKRAQMKRS